MRYPAIVDGEQGAYGVTFPDLPGITAMGGGIDEALAAAADALADAAREMAAADIPLPQPSPPESIRVPQGCVLATVPLLRLTGRARRANLTIDEGILQFIDDEARRRGMTRKAFIEWMARHVAGTAA